jgi:hypothetical protein
MTQGPIEEGGVITKGVKVGGRVWLGSSEGVIEGMGEGVNVFTLVGGGVTFAVVSRPRSA